MTYYVIEIQNPGGIIPTAVAPGDWEDPKAEAEAAYHSVLSTAAKSAVPRHGCMLINSDGDVEKREFYNHRGVTNDG